MFNRIRPHLLEQTDPEKGAPAGEPPKEEPKTPPKEDLSDLRAELERERNARKELEGKIQERERKEAEEKGQWEKLYKEEKEQWQAKEKNFILSQANAAFKEEAIKQGCQNPDDLAILMQKEIRKVKVDMATYGVDKSYMEELVSKSKESRSIFFNKPAPKTDDINQTKTKEQSSIRENLRKALF